LWLGGATEFRVRGVFDFPSTLDETVVDEQKNEIPHATHIVSLRCAFWLGYTKAAKCLTVLSVGVMKIQKVFARTWDFMKKLSFLLLLVASLQIAGCSNTSIETENANQKENKVSKNCGRSMTQRSKCKNA
jgi:hypothetical protein